MQHCGWLHSISRVCWCRLKQGTSSESDLDVLSLSVCFFLLPFLFSNWCNVAFAVRFRVCVKERTHQAWPWNPWLLSKILRKSIRVSLLLALSAVMDPVWMSGELYTCFETCKYVSYVEFHSGWGSQPRPELYYVLNVTWPTQWSWVWQLQVVHPESM